MPDPIVVGKGRRAVPVASGSPDYLCIASFASAVEAISHWFEDLVDGKDLKRLQSGIMSTNLPTLLEDSALTEADAVDLVVPVFLDLNPPAGRVFAGENVKVKFAGKASMGLLVLTGSRVIVSSPAGMMVNGQSRRWTSVSLAGPVELNALKFKMSLLSMSAASDGFELMADGVHLVFRFAFGKRQRNILDIFTRRMRGEWVPMFRGVEAVKYVAPGAVDDPDTALKPRPYLA